MSKTHKKRGSFIKNFAKTGKKALPAVNNGLKTVGKTTTSVVKKSIPSIKNGIAAIYGTIQQGFNLGFKGVKPVSKGVKNMSKRRGTRKNRRSKRR
jgi:hypothetical protein